MELVTREEEVGELEEHVESVGVEKQEEVQKCQVLIENLKLTLQKSHEQYSVSQEQVKVL